MPRQKPERSQDAGQRGRPRGFTIVELLIAMTLLSIIAVTGVQLLGLLLRADQSAGQQTARRMNLQRLAEDFRRDVHRADSIASLDADQPGTGLQLLAEGELIIYSQGTTGIVREVWPDSGAVRTSTETYLVPGEMSWQQQGSLVQMMLIPAADDRGNACHSTGISRWQLQAVLQRGTQP